MVSAIYFVNSIVGRRVLIKFFLRGNCYVFIYFPFVNKLFRSAVLQGPRP